MSAPHSDQAAKPSRRKRRRFLRADLITLIIIFGLMGAVYLLPPDTSLSEVRRIGTLKACVPASYPPLVTGDPDMPGFDIDLLGDIASRMGLRLQLNVNPQMGRDFNPRNWRVTRAQCEILAGGVAIATLRTATTREAGAS